MPRQVARVKTCHTWTRPLSVSPASTSGKTIESVWVTRMMRWRLTRSATVPPIVANRKTGASVTNEVTPRSADDPVRRKTSHDSATDCIQVPVSEMSWPPKKS